MSKLLERLNPKRIKHLDDIDELFRKYGIYSFATPFEWENETVKQNFWQEFTFRGHTHLESMQCICCQKIRSMSGA